MKTIQFINLKAIVLLTLMSYCTINQENNSLAFVQQEANFCLSTEANQPDIILSRIDQLTTIYKMDSATAQTVAFGQSKIEGLLDENEFTITENLCLKKLDTLYIGLYNYTDFEGAKGILIVLHDNDYFIYKTSYQTDIIDRENPTQYNYHFQIDSLSINQKKRKIGSRLSGNISFKDPKGNNYLKGCFKCTIVAK